MARRKRVEPSPPEVAERPRVPRRDAEGRIARFGELMIVVAGLLVFGVAALAFIDAGFSLVGSSEFGDVSGWLAGIPVVWLYIEDVRAWRGVRGRIGVLLISAALAVAAGFAVENVLLDLPQLVSGALAIITACLVFAPLWFFGIRWLDRQLG